MISAFISNYISNMSSEQTFQLVNESVSNQLAVFYENIAKDSAVNAVLKCAEMYGFDGNEAIQRLGLTSQKVDPVIRQAIPSSSSVVLQTPVPVPEPVVVKKSKPTKTDKKAIVISKPAFPLPYNGEKNDDLCHGLVLNEALFTQCQSFPKDGVYCVKCAKQCSTTDHGKPIYGTIQDRQQVGIMEYVDPKNRIPVEYVKVMNKYKVSRDDVIAEAGKFNMTIDPIHFEIADKKKGRPKNPSTRVVENTNEPDLFKDLISSNSSKTAVEVEVCTKAPQPTKASNAKDSEKQRKMEEKENEKKQKEAEKQRKLNEKKQKEDEKQRKLEEKEKKKNAPKEAPKKKATETKKAAATKTKEPEELKNEEEENDDKNSMFVNDTIAFMYNGKEHNRSIETNNVYLMNPENGYFDIVGKYHEATKTIIYDSKLYDDEESEESYDEEEEDDENDYKCGQYGCGEDDEEDEDNHNAYNEVMDSYE